MANDKLISRNKNQKMLFGQEFHGRKISTHEEMPSPARRLDARKGCAAAPGWWDQLVLQARGGGSSPPPPLPPPARLSRGNPSLTHCPFER